MSYHLSSAAPLIPVRVRSPIVQIPTANTTNRTIVRVAANGKDAHLIYILLFFYVFIFLSFFNSTYRRTNRRGKPRLRRGSTSQLFNCSPVQSAAAPSNPVRDRSPSVQRPTANTTNRTTVRVAANVHTSVGSIIIVYAITSTCRCRTATRLLKRHTIDVGVLWIVPTYGCCGEFDDFLGIGGIKES